jgi:hypothetical protein
VRHPTAHGGRLAGMRGQFGNACARRHYLPL